MAKQVVKMGAAPTGIGGDSYATAFGKVNENFTELYDKSATKATQVGEITTHSNVASFFDRSDIVKGALVIHVPKALFKSCAMLNISISGLNFVSNTGAWELQLTGYNYVIAWYNCSANLSGRPAINRVRFAWAEDHEVIIIGEVGTAWSYPAVLIKEITASYSNQDKWGSGITMGLETDLSAYSTFVEPALFKTANSATADTLSTARAINGVAFDGSQNITVADSTKLPLAGGTLSGQLITKPTAVATTLALLGQGATAPVRIPPYNVGTTYGYVPFIAGSVQSSSGYMTNVSIGTYKPDATWGNSGAYIAVGGSDASPSEAFLFQCGRTICNSTGAINLVGNADSATKLTTPRSINGAAFDGTTNITLAKPEFSGGLANYEVSDPNTLNTGGFNVNYLAADGPNRPAGVDHAIVTQNYSNIWSAQQAYDWRTGDMHTRVQSQGAWLGWATQVDTRNYSVTLPVFSTGKSGLVPARVGATATKYLCEDGTWGNPTPTTISGNAGSASYVLPQRIGGGDLNNYTTPGEYFCDLNADASVTLNAPIKLAYSLSITQTAGVVQTLTAYAGGNSRRFVRGFYSGAWSTWREVIYKDYLDSLASGAPVGSVSWGPYVRDKLPSGLRPADGQWALKADFPKLWALIEAGSLVCVTDDVWTASPDARGAFATSAADTTVFRLPDLNGKQDLSYTSPVLRGDGYSASGTMKGDAIRNITGSFSAAAWGGGGSGAITSWLAGNGPAGSNANNTSGYSFDASRQVPTADENRPKSSFGVYVVAIQ